VRTAQRTLSHHYKNQSVNAVQDKNRCLAVSVIITHRRFSGRI